jgi:16S rRNA (cytosine1402-N4)-methyltransferase
MLRQVLRRARGVNFERQTASIETMHMARNAAFALSTFLARQSSPFGIDCLWQRLPIGSRESIRLFASERRVAVDDEEENDLYLLAASASSDHNANKASSLYASTYHAPVMWQECIEALTKEGQQQQQQQHQGTAQNNPDVELQRNPRLYVDGTLGGGGHSQALLEALSAGDVVFGCDVDPDALAVARKRLSQYSLGNSQSGPWFIPVQSNFADLTPQLLWEHAPKDKLSFVIRDELDILVDGILLDLGVSSYQIDTAERGFAFMKDGPLDMRMNGQTGHLTAADLCNELDVTELRRIFSVYGDEPRARVIAESIMERRPLSTTGDLQLAVAAVTPQFARKGRRMGRMATLARVFQSLRIVVNHEDTVLERALTRMAPDLLNPGGRLAVLSYHSMEDRATKRVMRDGTVSKREANRNNEQKDLYGNYVGAPKPFRVVGKAQKASEAEVALNARARSATLRVAERV